MPTPPDDGPPAGPDEGWPETPDPWAEADRAHHEKWAEAPGPDEAPGYVPAEATPKAVHDAYGAGMRAAGPYLGLGVQIAASMALFAGGGYALDRWLGTEPWGLLVGAFVGMAGIVALLVRVARHADAEAKAKRAGRQP